MPHQFSRALTPPRAHSKPTTLTLFRWLMVSVMLLVTPALSSEPMGRFASLLQAVKAVRASETGDEEGPGNGTPVVSATPAYSVLLDSDIVYAEGLSQNSSSSSAVEQSQLLDIYQPDNDAEIRPVLMFIHGGGFKGGTKTKPEIVEMADYFASRGWVFVSVDYRTASDLGTIDGLSSEEVLAFYTGIAPHEWIELGLAGAETPEQVQQSVAMYAAQRDAKAALRWLVANATSYNINTDFISVGGASAGAITAIALGASELEDFRDEILVSDDPTLASTNLDESYSVQSVVWFWGSKIALDLFEAIYGLNRFDSGDPELFMAHGTDDVNPGTPFSEATELQGIYDPLGVHNELEPLEGRGHGAWNATVNGKDLFELSFDFLVARQNLTVE